jgi:parallel beta-helix repeat protein
MLAAVCMLPGGGQAAVEVVDEVHYTFTGPTSVAFDWRGAATDIRYGTTTSYGSTATAHAPVPLPFSSAGPFQEVELTGLQAGASYHYSVGGGVDHTFTTAPTGSFRFDVIADVGSSRDFSNVLPTQNQVAADNPAFVLVPGDLTYAEPLGQAATDQHFNDVMAWSLQAAYMPAWGNHEWENPTTDDLRNYKGRFVLPNPQTSPSAPAPGCCGEDWSWFDTGGVRFISYPEPYSSSTWTNWQAAAAPIFAAAQADPSVHFIVTFGHRPAYSTGFHQGETTLAGVLNTLGDQYSKYVLNLNGHSHDYERFQPIHGVTHITAAGGGSSLETPWSSTDSRTAFRAMHLEHLRVDVSSTGMRIEAVCGPPTGKDDITCVQGSVIDSYTIGANPPPPPPPAPTLYVAKGNANCSDGGSGTAAQPFCTIKPAASRVVAGQTVLVNSGTYNETVTVSSSGTASAPINFVAAVGATATVTGATTGNANAFYISGRSYVTVQGFNVTGTVSDGIVVKNSSNITIRGNHVSSAGQPVQGKVAKGIRLDGATDSIVATNTVDSNSDYGIYLVGSTRDQVVDNRVFANARVFERAASGIRLHSSPSNTISSNVSHDNEDSGIECVTGSNNNLVVNNVTYNNGDHGIDNLASTGQRVISNTVYKNVTAGINVEGTSTGATIANNISVDNGIGSTRTRGDIRVDSASTSGTTMDYDLVYLSTPDVILIWNSVNYTSLAAFKSATGRETRGTQADPKWTSPGGGDFHLTAGSPAIDSANSGASGQPSADADGNPRLDDPATPNVGVGPRAYDDRGAYEFEGGELDHIVISPSSATIAAGGSQAYTAQGFDGSGNSFDVTTSTTFSISPDGSCSGNVCTATAAGPHTVTGNDSGATATASLSVTAAVLDHLVLSPASATITSGGSQAYTAEGRDQYDNSLGNVTATTTFSISPNGSCTGATCTASAGGTHTVTGTKSGKTGTASLQVNAGGLDHIVISPASATITAGGSQAYTAEGFDASGNSVGDVTASTTFSIAPNGSCTGATCTATAAGAHTVTGNDGGKTSTSSLSVIAAALDQLVLSPASATIAAGGSQAYTAEGRDQYDNSLGDVTASTTFSISPNGSCTGATCTASAAGAHTVTGTKSGKNGTASLSVTAAALDHLVLSPASATIAAGGSQAYTAQGRDQYDNSLGDMTASTTFSISPNGSCTGATCTATAAGSHTVTGTRSGKTGTASLSVTAGSLDRIVISPATATINAGGSQTYTAEGFDAFGNSAGDVTAFTTFSVAPEGSCLGNLCTANAGGPHTVTGNDGGKTSTASLSVSFVSNSGFETDLSGWNTSGSGTGVTLTRVAGGHTGSWAAKVTNAGTTNGTCLLNDSPNWVTTTSSGTYTGSLWARADTAGKSLKLRFREYVGSTLVATTTAQVTLTTSWQQVTVAHTVTSPGSTLDFNAYLASADAPPGACFYADDAAIYRG